MYAIYQSNGGRIIGYMAMDHRQDWPIPFIKINHLIGENRIDEKGRNARRALVMEKMRHG